MSIQRFTHSGSRRSILAGLGATSLGLVAAPAEQGLAQVKPARQGVVKGTSLSGHPLTGAWMLTVPGGVAPAVFAADGTVSLTWPVCRAGVDGAVEYTTSGVGTWESTGEHSGHIHVVQVLSNDAGAFVGTRSLHLYPVASEDGHSLFGDGVQMRVFIRDVTNSVTAVHGEGGESPPISGIRMSPGVSGFPLPPGSPAEQ